MDQISYTTLGKDELVIDLESPHDIVFIATSMMIFIQLSVNLTNNTTIKKRVRKEGIVVAITSKDTVIISSTYIFVHA